MLLKEGNKDIQALVNKIDQKASIIRQQKILKDYPEAEKQLVQTYQNLVLPFIESYINTGTEIAPEKEAVLVDTLLEFLHYLLVVIGPNKQGELDEGVKDFIIGLAAAAATTFGGSKAKAQVPTGDKAYSAVAQQYLKKDTSSGIDSAEFKKTSPSSISIDFGTNFKSGKFEFDQADTKDLLMKFKAISDFIKAHPNSKFEVTIESSESRVPQAHLGFEQGELAKERANSLQTALKAYANNLEKQGVNTKGFDVKVENPVTQGPEWKVGDNKDDEKYTKNQYVKANIVAKDVAKPAPTVFDVFSSRGQSLYLNNKLIAIIFNRSRETKDVKVQGGYTIDDGDVLIRFVDDMGKFTKKDYLIDSKELQTNVRAEKATAEEIRWIERNGTEVN